MPAIIPSPPAAQVLDAAALIARTKTYLDDAFKFRGLPADVYDILMRSSINLERVHRELTVAVAAPAIPPNANISDRIESVHQFVPEVDELTDAYTEYVMRGGRSDFTTWRNRYHTEAK